MRYCELEPAQTSLLAEAIDRLRLSARSYHKLLRLARTLADLDGAEKIAEQIVAEVASQ